MADNEVPKNDENDSQQKKGVNRRQFMTRVAAGAGAIAATSVLGACGSSSASSPLSNISAQNQSGSAWKFGVMADTQWTGVADDGYNPNSSAVAIAKQIQQQFINQGVKLVVHVGDLSDNGSNPGSDTRALFAQPLYNAGIGFFPHRGNHDDPSSVGAAEFVRIYPQTQNGIHNSTPSDVLTTFATTDPQITADAGHQPVPAKTGSSFQLGSNFSSPTVYSNGLKGLSYSFDYNNVRFVLLDQFTPVGLSNGVGGWDAAYGSGSSTTIANQEPWIDGLLSTLSGKHAFVFSHKGLITCQHADGLFGSDPGQADPGSSPLTWNNQNNFMKSLASNKVGYYINGHDHMYDRALITSPDAKSKVMTLLTASDSSKFYVPAGSTPNYSGYNSGGIVASTPVPKGSTNDTYYNGLAGLPSRRTPITQELYTVGYYIFTVDGAVVTVDYYAADVNTFTSSASEVVAATTNGLNFTKHETFGYGLNGKQYLVAQGASYTHGAVQITYPTNTTAVGISDASASGTTATILYGSNNSAVLDACQQQCAKVVTTAWTNASGTASDILTLRGINPYAGAAQIDTYVLSLKPGSGTLNSGYALASLDANGNWTKAAKLTGSSNNFVLGPWSSSYTTPGIYGIDPSSNTAWAVLNYDGVFAICSGLS